MVFAVRWMIWAFSLQGRANYLGMRDIRIFDLLRRQR